MQGTHRIIVQNRRVRYEFEVRNKVTVLRGNSAAGKTVLVEMIREYEENGESSGIFLQCDKPCCVLDGGLWEIKLAGISDSIVFIEDGNSFVLREQFSEAVKQTDNDYVLITRACLRFLPYSAGEIYGMRSMGRYGTSKRVCNEFYRIYERTDDT